MGHNFERYCKDYQNIENYEKAKAGNFKGWCIHHRLETHNSDGERRLVDITKKELKALGMYYNRPAEELIFLPVGEHISLQDEGDHNPNYGKKHSEEAKKKMREAKKGKYVGEKSPMYGKKHSEETKKKIGAAHIGHHWYNNGKINKRAKECPPGFVPGILKKNN